MLEDRVVPSNSPPVANDDFATVNENTGFPLNSVTIPVLANDTDPDQDFLTVFDVTQGAHGSVSLGDGLQSVIYTPDFFFAGTDTFMYAVDDGNDHQVWATVTVTVTGTNQPPVAGGDPAETLQDTPVIIEVLGNDFDLDGDTLAVSQITQDPAHGSVVINPDNTVTYTPETGFSGTDTFRYTCTDGIADSNEATVTVTVDAVNQPPVANNDSATTDEDTPVTVNVLDNDGDVDGNPLLVTNVTQGSHGAVVTINADNTVTYTPALNYNGSDNFTYTISDGQGGFASANVSVTINPVNDAPAITSGDLNLSATPINEGGSVTLSGSFADPEADQTHTVVIGWGDGSSDTTLSLGAGVTSFGPLSHSYSDNGTFGISVSVTDSQGGNGSASKDLTVNTVAPTAALSGPSAAVPGQTRTFSFSATDPSAADTLAGFQFTINWGDGSSQTVNGAGSLDHAYASTGNFTVSVTATDKDGGVSTAATQAITVSAIALEQDPTDASKWAVFVGGTGAADTITFKPGSTAGQVIAQMVTGGTTTIGTWTPSGGGATFTVTVNGVTTVNTTVPATATLNRLVAYGNAGDDSISVAKNGSKMLAVSAYLFADSGNDTLDVSGSSGNNVLVGAAGNDKLSGGAGRDILIGGGGTDTLKAGSGGDIVIGESTDYDANITALTALLAEWSGGSSYNVRINHLSGQPGGLNGPYVLTNATVHGDGVSDQLFGGAGQEWFFAQVTGVNADNIKKQDAGETVTAL